MSVEKEKWEGELGRTIILASHSLLNERKVLLAENKRLRKDIAGWINWCYYLPESWKPKPMIEKSKQVLEG